MGASSSRRTFPRRSARTARVTVAPSTPLSAISTASSGSGRLWSRCLSFRSDFLSDFPPKILSQSAGVRNSRMTSFKVGRIAPIVAPEYLLHGPLMIGAVQEDCRAVQGSHLASGLHGFALRAPFPEPNPFGWTGGSAATSLQVLDCPLQPVRVIFEQSQRGIVQRLQRSPRTWSVP